MRASRRARALGLSLLGGAVAACAERPGLDLVEVRPAPEAGPLRRNEPVTLLFDRQVDPSSVSAASVRIARADGTPAAGRLEVDGRRVRFVPRPGSTPEYEDGGYGAGDRITLALPGFPSRGVLTAGTRAPLGAPVRFALELAPLPGGAPSPATFVDPVPGGPRLARAPATAGDLEVPAGAALALHFSEPLFPPIQEPVRLRFDDRDRTPVPTSTELVQGERDAVLLVRPADGFKEGTRYLLELRPEHLTDLVGHPFEGRGLPQEYGVRAVAAAEDGK